MPTAPLTTAEHHYQQAEQTLAALGSLAATSEEATREVPPGAGASTNRTCPMSERWWIVSV